MAFENHIQTMKQISIKSSDVRKLSRHCGYFDWEGVYGL